jgi:hypothetical protein
MRIMSAACILMGALVPAAPPAGADAAAGQAAVGGDGQQQSAANHALIISVSAYPRSPLKGVLLDRRTATTLAQRFGVPPENIDVLSESAVTRESLQAALAQLDRKIMPGDKLYIYFSGHGARFLDQNTGECTESLVMQNLGLVTKDEFAQMVKPLSLKADKTVVMLDSCHSGGVAQTVDARGLDPQGPKRAKFDAEVSSAACAHPVNLRGFSAARGIEFDTTDNNLVILAAARSNEVAWDTDKGGALTYNFEQCLNSDSADTDRSGSVSMQELADCVQGRLDRSQDEGERQHVSLTGNGALIPEFGKDSAQLPAPGPAPAPASPAAPTEVDTLAALNDIYQQRDDRWNVSVALAKPVLKIGTDLLDFSVTSQRDGFVYVFYRGSQPDAFYLLFPNKMDAQNVIKANETLRIPRATWTVNALGPQGTDHILVMVSATPRDFGDYALPAQYVSNAGPFGKIRPTLPAMARINRIATLSSALKQPECQGSKNRDLGIARSCSSVFGAALINVDEVN